MEKLVSTSIVVSFAIAIAASVSCSFFSSESLVGAQSNNPVTVPTPSPTESEVSPLSSNDLATLKKYAEAYEPKSGREVIPSPPIPNDRISEIIAKASKSNSRDHEAFIILIFLRLSRFQIEHFRQRYELGRDNPLTREFYRLIGENDYARREIMLAYLADNYVEKNPELLNYPLIDAEMQRIDMAGKKIENELNRIRRTSTVR
ncbi:MAG: hypothetical protein ABI857_00100 [Acidobacteriota bacterium]